MAGPPIPVPVAVPAEESVGPASPRHYFAALWVGFLATPLAVVLSLQLFPFGAPALIYGALSGTLAILSPEPGWRWGLWTTTGMVGFTLGAAAYQAAFLSPELGVGLIQIGALLGIVPAAIGGCVLAGLMSRLQRGH